MLRRFGIRAISTSDQRFSTWSLAFNLAPQLRRDIVARSRAIARLKINVAREENNIIKKKSTYIREKKKIRKRESCNLVVTETQ